MLAGIRPFALRIVVVALSVLGAVTGLRSALVQMEIQLRAVKSSLLVGEPLIVLISLRTEAPVDLEADLMFRTAPLRVLIDRGHGFVPHVEKRWVALDRDRSKGPLPGGQAKLEYVLALEDDVDEWVFAQPGTYQVVAEYRDDTLGPFRSNVVTVSVQAPTGEEKAAHDAVRIIGPRATAEPSVLGALSPVADRYPSSVYVQQRRLEDLRFRIGQAWEGYDPTLDELPASDPPILPDLRPDVVSARLADLIPAAQALVRTASQFEPDALLELGDLYLGTGQRAQAQQVFREVVERFPERKAATEAKSALADTLPPTLQIAASPSTLWPPNHKLVQVTIALEASDDIDPSPTVKLESIVCEDGPRRACLSWEDITGAEYGTDDRLFELRASRLGGITERIYTITYSATDAAGNKATAATTVTVPHDQSKKVP